MASPARAGRRLPTGAPSGPPSFSRRADGSRATIRHVLPRIDPIPLPPTAEGRPVGRLFAAGFSAVGPDPDDALTRLDAQVMVCLLTPHEIDLRFPEYARWLDEHSPRTALPKTAKSALWLPTDDGDVSHDTDVLDLVERVVAELRGGSGVITHCGAGMARTAVISILSMIALGADPSAAATDFRAARPGGGPDGIPQASQIDRLVGAARRL